MRIDLTLSIEVCAKSKQEGDILARKFTPFTSSSGVYFSLVTFDITNTKIDKQSQTNTAESELFLTSLQVLQFPQRGDLEER